MRFTTLYQISLELKSIKTRLINYLNDESDSELEYSDDESEDSSETDQYEGSSGLESKEETKVVINRPKKFVKLTYEYEVPKEVPCNVDFVRGDRNSGLDGSFDDDEDGNIYNKIKIGNDVNIDFDIVDELNKPIRKDNLLEGIEILEL
mgnify:CR=1 FL=1